jgi:SAM-dependent methyltransferase
MAVEVALERFTPGSGSDRELQAQHQSRYEFAAGYTAGRRIIDVACGSGYGSAFLKSRGAESVTGIDVSEEAITYAKEHYAADGVSFLLGDAGLLRDAGRADCIVSFETIEHLEDPGTFLSASRDALGPGGLFIVSTPVRPGGSLSDRPANPFHIREWNQEEFDRLLAEYFPVRNFYYQYVYRKRPYPLSRTLNKWSLRSLFPDRSSNFDRFPVVAGPWNLPTFLVERGYMVAVCSGRDVQRGSTTRT